ncbi:hypothetical protein [Sulfuriflexus mobilis]|uniref:hypothetical protein n=1 Tax=Sulfuriflexus mobilis TaxID=1811807 RepID=UPI000F84AAAF|nr:hypothetical protein [Sulfuriflexus mobilis]
MGFSTHYSKDHNFMLTNISGDITDNGLMQHIVAYDKEIEKLPILKELSDCRQIQSITSLSTQAATSAADGGEQISHTHTRR